MFKSTAAPRGNTNSIGGDGSGGGTSNNIDIETPSAEIPPHLAVGASIRSSLRHFRSQFKKMVQGDGASITVT